MVLRMPVMVPLVNMHVLFDSRELELGILSWDIPHIFFLIKFWCKDMTQLFLSLLDTLIVFIEDMVLSKIGHKVIHFKIFFVIMFILSATSTAANWITLRLHSHVRGRSSQLLSVLIIESIVIVSNISLCTGQLELGIDFR